jgi:hypothetical protein
VEITPEGLELFDAAHVAAEPLAERLVAELEPGEPERLADLLARFAHPESGEAQPRPDPPKSRVRHHAGG